MEADYNSGELSDHVAATRYFVQQSTVWSLRTRSHTPGCFSLTTLPSHRAAMSLGPTPSCCRSSWQRRAGEKRSGSTPRPQTPSSVSHPSPSTFRFMNSVCDGKCRRVRENTSMPYKSCREENAGKWPNCLLRPGIYRAWTGRTSTNTWEKRPFTIRIRKW